MKQKEMQKKARKAAVKYLEARGYEVIDQNYLDCIIAREYDTIVIVGLKVQIAGDFDGEPAMNPDERREFERVAMAYLREHDEFDKGVRFDKIDMVVVRDDRAFVRHFRDFGQSI